MIVEQQPRWLQPLVQQDFGAVRCCAVGVAVLLCVHGLVGMLESSMWQHVGSKAAYNAGSLMVAVALLKSQKVGCFSSASLATTQHWHDIC